MLAEGHKLQRVEILQRLLLRCEEDNGDEDMTNIGVGPGGDFRAKNNLFDNLITGDKTWVHLNTPKKKRDSVTWKHPSSPVTKKKLKSAEVCSQSDGYHVQGCERCDLLKHFAPWQVYQCCLIVILQHSRPPQRCSS
ncbi:histone-lysine N-methyltransferase SETMAR [Elysia marginata]|uniref:Histone-lysine N-methyltransferase SETMAR n=1 Tax=Elysia marginata TaxID=1093978 RepID=A0AAV4GXD6_9GAST|nr:histone-lysine N-methyltransferase SETMAR [Elysia marginata]